MPAPGPLGEYLRARRELVDPATAGLRVLGVRRTPGLRREEVATLAGVSADYYLRLEQGRDRNPSRQVLEALARALQLDEIATSYLLGLGEGARPVRSRRAQREPVPAGVLELIGSLDLPAFVEDRRLDILAANPAATALDPTMAEGENRLRALFLDERAAALYRDRDRSLREIVASFRASIGTGIGDPRAQQLVGELSLASEDFRRLWARHDVAAIAGGRATIDHPVVGTLDLRRQKLPLGGTDGQILAIYHAAPGTPSADALRRLAAAPGDSGEAARPAG